MKSIEIKDIEYYLNDVSSQVRYGMDMPLYWYIKGIIKYKQWDIINETIRFEVDDKIRWRVYKELPI